MPVKNATKWESFALSQLNVLADKLAKLHMKEHRTSDTEVNDVRLPFDNITLKWIDRD